MKEYKFRGKEIDTGKWVYGFYLEQDTYNMGSKRTKKDLLIKDAGLIVQNSKYDSATVIDKETIGQYTGLKDKNGKEIYEGDILKIKGKCYAVYYDRGNFCIGKPEPELKYSYDYKADLFQACLFQESEIVGNIYSNSELLEEGE